MAKFEEMIPFLLRHEAGLKKKYLTLPLLKQFARAKLTGYANDPNDSGGPTMCGVTLNTYASYRRRQGYQSTTISDLKAISFVAWCAILKTMYWDRCKGDQIANQMLAVAIVDWCWGSGVKGIKGVQRVLGVEPDGVFGPVTLAAVNSHPDHEALFNAIQDARNKYHASIAKPGTKNAKWLNGWNNRVASITFNGFIYGEDK